MEMVRNPSVMQEMMRTHDRALSNLEVTYHTAVKVPFILKCLLKIKASSWVFSINLLSTHIGHHLQLIKWLVKEDPR